MISNLSHCKPRSIFQLELGQRNRIYSQTAINSITSITENNERAVSRSDILDDAEQYRDVEIIFLSGWSAAKMDAELLSALPNLKVYFYGAGSVRKLVTEAFWKREIKLSSAYKVNATPVVEYSVSSIVMGLKQAWHFNAMLKAGRDQVDYSRIRGVYYGSRVGIISLGAIGQNVARILTSQHDVDVFAYDPFAEEATFSDLCVTRVDSLDALFSHCEVVSLHAPWLQETEGLISGDMLRSMPPYGTFINTSRGAIVREEEMLEVLQERSDLCAVLDLIQDQGAFDLTPLARLPNVFITPHIAGSMGNECQLMGDFAVAGCKRYLQGILLECQLTQKSAEHLA